jgi:lipoprotein NlpI
MADYHKVVEINAKYPTVYNNMGMVYYKMEKYGLARDSFSKSLELDPKDVTALANRAAAYGKLGQNDLAAADKAKIKELTNGK